MKMLKNKHGLTVVSSNEFRFFDKLKHEKVIYEVDLQEKELHMACNLRQRGLVLKVNDNGKTKYKIYPQQETL